MSQNSEGTPQPVTGDLAEDWRYIGLLPRAVRLAYVECIYEYSPKMVYDMFQYFRTEHFMTNNTASEEVIRQLLLNDANIQKQEMLKKWNGQTPPIALTPRKSNFAHSSPTKRTGSTANRSEIHRFVRGIKPPTTSAIPLGMVFDLSGTALIPLSSLTKTGSSSRKRTDGPTAR